MLYMKMQPVPVKTGFVFVDPVDVTTALLEQALHLHSRQHSPNGQGTSPPQSLVRREALGFD